MNKQLKLFEDIIKFIENSKILLSEGTELELAGLDKQVQNLCIKVLELSPDERDKYADSLKYLMNELTVLGADLAVEKEALEREIYYLSSHKKAHVAYKIADAKDSLDDMNADN